MKLNNIKKNIGTILLLTAAIIILIIPSLFVTKYSSIEGKFICNKINESASKCAFNCSITPGYIAQDKIDDLKGRAIVYHSVWTAIFDETYDMQSKEKHEFMIEVPKRNYFYTAIVSIYDVNGNVGVSNKINLQC